jgi:outer membrane lipoprotein-sorting protein
MVEGRKEGTLKSRLLKSAGLALVTLVLQVVSGDRLQAQAFGSAHWKSKGEIEGGQQGSMATDSELWMKDKKLRIKTTAMGMKMNVVKSGDFIYQWQEGQTSGMKMPANMRQQGGAAGDYVSRIEEVRAKGTKVGAETLNGHACDVYEYTETERGRAAKQTYWLAKDLKNFPIKVVADLGDAKMTTVNSDIELGVSVPDSLVTPPADVTFQDMSEMMKGRAPRN